MTHFRTLSEADFRRAAQQLAPYVSSDLLKQIVAAEEAESSTTWRVSFFDADGDEVAALSPEGAEVPDEIALILAESEEPDAEDALSFADLDDDDGWHDDFVIESDDEWLPSSTAGLIGPDAEDRLIDKLYW